MTPQELIKLYPAPELGLLSAGGRELVERIGADAVKQVVLAVMKGENLRNETELLTRRKIAISSGALVMFFINGIAKNPRFLEDLPKNALAALKDRSLTKQQRWVINWMLGLTDKAVQNVLRDDVHGPSQYHKNYKKALLDVSSQLGREYGVAGGVLEVGGGKKVTSIKIDWDFLLHLLGATGTQAMTIRGSDKSTYGKLFERLILGSLMHVLGFKLVEPDKHHNKMNMVYWLSERKEKRESDATVLIKPGIGVRFDIGFIGRGNTEISLDKVSRFEKEMSFGRVHHTMGTFIIVDRIGARSRLMDLAARIQGIVVQMSMSYWPREVAKQLTQFGGFKHPLAGMSDADVEKYLSVEIAKVPIKDFLPSHFDLGEPDDEGDDA
jgi:hypothetical protein